MLSYPTRTQTNPDPNVRKFVAKACWKFVVFSMHSGLADWRKTSLFHCCFVVVDLMEMYISQYICVRLELCRTSFVCLLFASLYSKYRKKNNKKLMNKCRIETSPRIFR